jgi:integrase
MPNWSNAPNDKVLVGRGVLRKLLPSRVWHFHYKDTDKGNHWTSKSTSHRDKDGAIEWATGFSLKLTRREQGLPEPEKKPTNDLANTAIQDWLRYQRSQNSSYTVRTYTSVTANFERFLKEHKSVKRLGEIDAALIVDFRDWHLKRGNSKVTVDNNLVTLRSFLNWCVATNRLRSHPVHETRHGASKLFFGAKSPRKETYTPKEYWSVVGAAGKDLKLVCTLLGNTGMRIAELAMLEWTDIDPRGSWLKIRNKRTHDGIDYHPKDKTDRKVPINPAVETVLSEIATAGFRAGYLISLPKVKDRRDYAERHFIGLLKGLEATTGIKKSKLTLHNFRRFFVSQCADCGIPMATVMDWVGHDELQMVLYYYRLRDEAAKAAMKRFRIDGGEASASACSAVSASGTRPAERVGN